MTTLTPDEIAEIAERAGVDGAIGDADVTRLLQHIRAQDEKLRRVEQRMGGLLACWVEPTKPDDEADNLREMFVADIRTILAILNGQGDEHET